MTDLVLREDKDGLTTLTLNRPDKLNALNVPVFQELEAHIEAIEGAPDEVALVTLKGAGRCFSAGHDLGDIASGEKLPRPNYQAHVIERMANLPQPVISAIHGHCYTGALELALGADILIASENAKLADTHARWALTPVWGISQRLPRRVGQAKAAEMMFSARTYSGREAEAMGLVNLCFSDDTYEEELEKFARDCLENSWFSLRANKSLLLESEGMSLKAGLAHEIYHSPGRGPDMEERISRFLKK